MRKSDYPIESLLLKQCTTREMTGKGLSDAELKQVFEAMRWTSSSFNAQPWYVCYVTPNDDQWQQYMDLVNDKNAIWAKNASCLLLISARKYIEYKGEKMRNHAASFDVGASCQSLRVQAAAMNLACALIGGFNHGLAAELLENEDFVPQVMVTLGYKKDPCVVTETTRCKHDTFVQRGSLKINEGR